MAVGESNAFVHELIEVRRIDVGEAKGVDGIKALLICDDENEVGAALIHSFEWAAQL